MTKADGRPELELCGARLCAQRQPQSGVAAAADPARRGIQPRSVEFRTLVEM